MRRWAVGWLLALGGLAACAGTRGAVAQRTGASATERRYVDRQDRFELWRPEGHWVLDPRRDLAMDGMSTPVLLRNVETGTQVVVQLAPALATPSQLAERLTEDLREREGFVATDPEPLPLAEGAVGFEFAMEQRVGGRVVVLEAGDGRVFMLLATWPLRVPGATQGVDEIFRSVRRLPRG